MIYRHCDECGFAVRKRTYKGKVCPRCNREQTWWEEDVPREELSIVDDAVDEMVAEDLKRLGLIKT